MIGADSKLYPKLARRVRAAKASSPSVAALYVYSAAPVFDAPSAGLLIDGVLVRFLYPSHVLPPGARP